MINKDIDNLYVLIKKKYKQILVEESTYQALQNLGKTGQSFNDVISKLVRVSH